MKMHLKLLSAKQWPYCPGEDELAMGYILRVSSKTTLVVAVLSAISFKLDHVLKRICCIKETTAVLAGKISICKHNNIVKYYSYY